MDKNDDKVVSYEELQEFLNNKVGISDLVSYYTFRPR